MSKPQEGEDARISVVVERGRMRSPSVSPAEAVRATLASWCKAFRSELQGARQLLNDGVGQLQQGFNGMAQQIAARDRLLQDLLTLLVPGDRDGKGAKGIQEFAAEATGLVSAVAQRSSETGQWTLNRLQGISAALAETSTVVGGIEELSIQIRFLSLNAAIEAARAGDHYPAFGAIAQQVERVSSEAARLNAEVAAAISRMQQSVADVMVTARSAAKDLEEHAGVLRTHADEMNTFIAARTAAAAELRQPVSISVTALQLDDVIGQILQRLEARMLELEPLVDDAVAAAAGTARSPRETASPPAYPRSVPAAGLTTGRPAPVSAPVAGTPREFRAGTVELF